MNKLTVVVGGQFGSEGKGMVVGELARREEGECIVIRTGGPNAGHTAYSAGGNRWALRQIPIAAVTNPNASLCIAADSEIDREVLRDELRRLETTGHYVVDRLYIDAEATVIDAEHKQQEAELVGRIGSTGKGIGAARAARLMRTANRWADVNDDINPAFSVAEWVRKRVRHKGDKGVHVIIEGTQGYGLGLHAGYYPKCTSRDVRAVDLLASVGISPWESWVDKLEVVVVMRPYPIRVAGDSGPLYNETSWPALNLPEEKTTVTQKVRRVGGWDPWLAARAVAANGGADGCVVALTMFDHVLPFTANKTALILQEFMEAEQRIKQYESDCGARVRYVGTGPSTLMTWQP